MTEAHNKITKSKMKTENIKMLIKYIYINAIISYKSYKNYILRRSEETTILEAYFVFPNGTALDYDAVTSILNSEEVYKEYGAQLTQLGFTGIVSGQINN